MFDKMKELWQMQKKMQEVKRELDGTTFEITSSDGSMKVTMNGSQEVVAVNIEGDIQKIDKARFQTMIKDTYNKAIKRSHEIAAQKMKNVTGLNIPGL